MADWSTVRMTSTDDPARTPIRTTPARACRDTRLALDLTQQAVADRAGVTRSYIARLERGDANPSIARVQVIAQALGLDVDLAIRRPTIIGGPRVRDAVHARCSAHVARRSISHGWEVAREIEIVHRRSHGWIDLLAFDPRSRTLLVVEVKTRLDDLGAVERQLGWYERAAWDRVRELGWEPRRVRSWVLVLASEEVERVLTGSRSFVSFQMRYSAERRGRPPQPRPAAPSMARAPAVTKAPSEPRPMNRKPRSRCWSSTAAS